MAHPMLLVGESTSNQNLYYRTGFLAGDPFAYAEVDGHAVLLVAAMERGRAEKESRVRDIRTFADYGFAELVRTYGDRGRALSGIILRLANDLGISSARVEPGLPLQHGDALRQGGIELTIDRSMVLAERRRKSPDEVAALERSQAAAERALSRAVELIAGSEERGGLLHFGGIPLTSERVRAEIELHLLRENMVCDVETTVAGGTQAADPHGRGRGPLRWGEAIVMDVFPRSKESRYYADITRTVARGEPNAALQEMYDAVLGAQEAALSRVRAGANGAEIHRAVLETYRAAGFSGDPSRPWMQHGTGHGVGLDIHEAPHIGEADMEIRAGDVITIEPGLYHPEIGGVRIEDLVAVTEDGYQNLTHFPKQLLV